MRLARKPPAAFVLLAFAWAALFTWLVAWQPFSSEKVEEEVFLHLLYASPTPGLLNISLDAGHGYFVDRSPEYSGPLVASTSATAIECKLPPGRVREIQLEVEQSRELRIFSGTIHTASGVVLATLPLQNAQGLEGTGCEMQASTLVLKRAAKASSVIATFAFPECMAIPTGAEPWPMEIAVLFCSIFAGILGLCLRFGDRGARIFNRHFGRLQAALEEKPRLVIIAVAVLSTLLSTYPVVFLGKSFVSPNTLAYLLYLGEPTILNAPHEGLEHGSGADLGAMMWQNLPYSAVQSDAILHDHELPLWNRYNSSGNSLLGQGLSMFGDPLHLIPILAGGKWWAWDIKFVLARILFATGIGFAAWDVTKRLWPSAAMGASVAWIGFFIYRYNHPGYFSLCYAPWILLAWLRSSKGSSWPGRWAWALLLVGVDLMELCSGTVKESCILLLGLNICGLLYALGSGRTFRERLLMAVPCLWASLLALLISAPGWLLFLDSLKHSLTIYDAGRAFQLQPGLVIAFFEGIFSQDFTRNERVTQGSLNFFVLAGLLAASCKAKRGEHPADRAIGSTSIVAALFVFGIIPPSLVIQIPFIGKIEHIYNAFGCVLLVLLPVVAAQGLASAADWNGEEWRQASLGAGLTVCLLAAAYFGFVQAKPLSAFSSYRLESFSHSRFFEWYVPSLLTALLLCWVATKYCGTERDRLAGVLLLIPCLLVLHFRNGMYESTKFDAYVMNPKSGVDLYPASPAVTYLHEHLVEPARVYGFSATLAPGYNSLLRLEGISGPDALHNPYYQELCEGLGVRQVWDWRWVVDPETTARLVPAYDLLNLRYFLRELDGPSPKLERLRLAARGDLEIYESNTVWPRAFFTDQCSSYKYPTELAQLVARDEGRPFAAMQGVSLAETTSFERRSISKAREYRLTSNSTEFVVDANAAGYALLCETFEDGNFLAEVNGQPASVLRMNHAFKGVRLPEAGTYHIKFTYHPRYLTLSLLLSAIGGLALALTAIGVALRARFKTYSPPLDQSHHCISSTA